MTSVLILVIQRLPRLFERAFPLIDLGRKSVRDVILVQVLGPARGEMEPCRHRMVRQSPGQGLVRAAIPVASYGTVHLLERLGHLEDADSGLGGIGLNVIQGAAMVGAGRIIGIDLNPDVRDHLASGVTLFEQRADVHWVPAL